MKKKNVSRRIISLMMVLFLFMAFCSSALAYEFIFSFPSSESSLPATKYTTAKRTTSVSAPYVKHDANVTPTNYHLQYREGSSISVVYDPIASASTITNYSTTVKKSFTYKTGYGGAGQYIYMVGVPTAATKGQKYYAYTSGGTWSP